MPILRYHSKQDWWVGVLVWGPLVLLVVVAGYQLTSGGPEGQGQALALAALLYGGIMRALAHPVYYEIDPPALRIRSGLLHYSIPLAGIDSVRPTRNPLSAPALSLDRLRIDYRKGKKAAFALISPEDRAAFLRALASCTEGLEAHGDTLTRTGAR